MKNGLSFRVLGGKSRVGTTPGGDVKSAILTSW